MGETLLDKFPPRDAAHCATPLRQDVRVWAGQCLKLLLDCWE